jgi:hypothetical protein
LKAAIGKELLFAHGEGERVAAITAGKGFFGVIGSFTGWGKSYSEPAYGEALNSNHTDYSVSRQLLLQVGKGTRLHGAEHWGPGVDTAATVVQRTGSINVVFQKH